MNALARTVGLSLGLLLTTILAIGTAHAAAGSPLATLKQRNGEFDRILKQKPAVGSPAEKKQHEDIRAMAAQLLDYGELAKRALAQHWDTLTAAERTEFVASFQKLIEKNYVKQLHTSVDYTVKYGDEAISGDEATVNSTVKVKTQGKSTESEIVYKMHKVGDRWLAWDVITDEHSLVRNYRTQFNKIITEKSYNELLRRMKSKGAEDAPETD